MQRGFSPNQKEAGVESAQVRELAALSGPTGRGRIACDDRLDVRGANRQHEKLAGDKNLAHLSFVRDLSPPVLDRTATGSDGPIGAGQAAVWWSVRIYQVMSDRQPTTRLTQVARMATNI